jgi:CheY-like chemotaxis protein
MVKIMLVEDDKALREIYGVRLLAEGYDIVSAGDGEEALAMAIKERPQLIVSDVMMPKISGFDMLDILRSTTETKNIKVIMMTALSSEEQRSRGESLGADRYLVKSQVGIEDVVRVVHEVLEDTPVVAEAAAPQPQAPVMPATPVANPAPTVTPAPTVPVAPMAAPTPVPAPQPMSSSFSPQAPSVRNKIIQPLNDPRLTTVDINDLVDKELAKESSPVPSIADEQSIIDEQLAKFARSPAFEQLDTSTEPVTEPATVPGIDITADGTITSPASAPTVPAAPVAAAPDMPPQPAVTAPPAPAFTVPSRAMAQPAPTAMPTPTTFAAQQTAATPPPATPDATL